MIDLAAVKAGRGLTERSACRRLARLARAVPSDEVIVELGAFRGRTTAWLAWGAEHGHHSPVVAVDPWDRLIVPEVDGYLEPQYERGEYADPDTRRDFDTHLARCRVSRVSAVQATAVDGAEIFGAATSVKVGLLFHDALHTADQVAADLAAWMPHLAPACVVALHDVAEVRFGVAEGAERVLPAAGFDWEHRKIYRWKKHPDRRGLLVVRRR